MLAYKVVEVSTFCDYTEVHYTSAFFRITPNLVAPNKKQLIV